ncbi:MAG: iron-containing redox enzyme family protein [Ilumatobacteraceae bacterium]
MTPRGPLSAWVLTPSRWASGSPDVATGSGSSEDLQLALYLCYEPHYHDVDGLPADAEWHPDLLEFRRRLEGAFECSLRELVGVVDDAWPVREAIPRLIEADDGPSVSRHMETRGTPAQMIELLKHRSAYQLKEADPHTFAIPHLSGRAKQILAAIQAGEYGADAPDRSMHSSLYAQTMRAFGLDDRPNAYLDELPASALMISNLISYFGLHRMHRARLVGHLAVFEMTSVVPMGRYARGLERMGAPEEARRFYDVHVLADAEHEHMALAMADALEQDEPGSRRDVLFGAHCVLATERLFALELLGRWEQRELRPAAAA